MSTNRLKPGMTGHRTIPYTVYNAQNSNFLIFSNHFFIMGVAQPRCSCTPGYTCRGNCIIKELSTSTEENRKREYCSSFRSSWQRVASTKQQKRLHFPSMCKEITDYAVSKKCCSINCIYNLVETQNILQVANAVQSARKTCTTQMLIVPMRNYEICSNPVNVRILERSLPTSTIWKFWQLQQILHSK